MAPGAAPAAQLAFLAVLGTLLPGPGGARTSIHPSKAIIPRGGSLKVNCSISCDQKATFGLETELTKKVVGHGNNWKVFELSDVQEDINLLCYSNCRNEQTIATMNLTVYWIPERVELAPLPLWQPVGEELNLSCLVSGGAPRDHLSVVLLRGEEELGRQPVGKGEPAEVMFTVQRRPVKCTLDGLFPAWDAEVYLVLGDQKLKSNTMYNGDSVLAEAWLEENEEGTHSLKCSVNLCRATSTRGIVTREVVLNVLREFEFWDGQGRGHLASSTLTAVLCPPHRRPEYPGHCHSSSSCGPHLGCSGHCRLHLQLPAEDPDIRAFLDARGPNRGLSQDKQHLGSWPLHSYDPQTSHLTWSHRTFWVRVSPDFKAVPLGGSLWLNCSSSCPLPEGSSLRTELRRGETLSGPRWVAYQLLDVRAWSSDVHCFVTCHARLNLDGLVVLSSSSPVTLPVPAWSPVSKALASTSIAGCVGIFLVVGALCLRKYLSMQPPA